MKNLNTSGDEQGLVDLRVPQFGEGIHEVRIVAIRKQANETIEQDEVVYELETSKSVFEIESEFRGTIVEWLVRVDDVVEVGSTVARIATATKSAAARNEKSPAKVADVDLQEDDQPELSADAPQHFIPPRTRAYAKEQGLSRAELESIMPAGRKVLPSDVDKFMRGRRSEKPANSHSLSSAQRLLNQQMALSKDNMVTATMVAVVSYSQVQERLKQEFRKNYGANAAVYVTPVQLIAFYIARIAKDFEKFRSRLVDANTYSVSDDLNLGMAVETDDQNLVTAVVEKSNTLSFQDFVEKMTNAIDLARKGKDQSSARPQIVVSYLGSDAIIHGSPLLVAPSVATIAVGAVDTIGVSEPRLSLSLTFDHRLITGMEASRFLQTVLRNLTADSAAEKSPQPSQQRNQQTDTGKSKAAFVKALTERVSGLLNIDVRKDLMDESLGLLGLDSIKAKELIAFLEGYFSSSFPSTFLWHNPTLAKVVEYGVTTFGLSDAEHSISAASGDIEDFLRQIQGELSSSK